MRIRPFIAIAASLGLVSACAASNAIDNQPKVIATMKSELMRSYNALRKTDLPAYFIAYRLFEKESAEVAAHIGSVTRFLPYQHRAYASVEVRVGDYQLDSSRRLVNDDRDQAESTLGAFGVVPLDDGKPLQTTFWLETEKEYRVAAQRYGKVLAQRGLKTTEESECADFSKQAPSVTLKDISWDSKLDVEPFKESAKKLSMLFENYKSLEHSWAQFKLGRTKRFLVNSEGTEVCDKSSSISFNVGANTTAIDGEKIWRTEVFYFSSPDDLKKLEPQFENLVKTVAASVEELAKAPLADPYCGPVMLRGQAAAVLFHEVLGHRLEASRHRENFDGKTFTKMLGQKILPPFISVYDRPSVQKIGDIELNGAYEVDDDGVPARDVALVQNGVLTNFLTSRTPTTTCSESNGHGRCGDTSSAIPSSRMANLIVESAKTVPEDQLRQQLIAEVKKQNKKYGLIIEQVNGGETNTSSYQPQVFQVRPGVVRRVYVDGRPDDFIRGVRIIGTPMSALQHIVMTADKTEVMNGFCGAESGWVAQANCCPSILVDSLEIERETTEKGIARILPPPPKESKEQDAKLD